MKNLLATEQFPYILIDEGHKIIICCGNAFIHIYEKRFPIIK